MQFKHGAEVVTAGNQPVGHVDRVVVDPRDDEITGIVVRKGILFTEDKVVPVDLIASSEEDRIMLRADAGDLDALPDFEETYYVPGTAGPAEYAPPVFWYPTFGVPPERVAAPWTYHEEIRQNIPEGAVPLQEGARVISADDEHVGDVDLVLTDPQADRVTHFVVSQGLLAKSRKLVPLLWVDEIHEDEVCLAVPASVLQGLPDYKG